MKRSAVKRSSKRIARRSERALALLGERASAVDEAWDRDRGRCQAEHLVPEVRCGGPLDPHEIIPRSVWPGGERVVMNIAIICRNHHCWIDNHPDAAHAVGLHGYSWERS